MVEATTTYAPSLRRLDAFVVFLKIREMQKRQRPAAIIRLGDGEGAVLGYPKITSRTDVDSQFRRNIRRTNVPDREIFTLQVQLRNAIENADILGVPRSLQTRQHRLWAAVDLAISKLSIQADLTHTALHRLMSHALLFRPILRELPFVGLVSCRDVSSEIQRLFGIEQTRWYGVRGALDKPGIVETPHWPDGFNEIRQTLEVPFPGALFIVGAGLFGKIYCHWIKKRGGIAIDIGSIFDSWAKVGRVGHPVRSLDVYREHPTITREAAVKRYNELLQVFNLDVPEPSEIDMLPETW